jgi:hypothetical protein
VDNKQLFAVKAQTNQIQLYLSSNRVMASDDGPIATMNMLETGNYFFDYYANELSVKPLSIGKV